MIYALSPQSWIVFGESFLHRFPGWEERRATKAWRFSDAQKAFILKQGADGMPVADICRKAGISQATYFNWKRKYGGLLPTEIRRLRQLEDGNGKLRKVVADLSPDKEMLHDANPPKALKPGRKRKLVDEVRGEWGVSIRRACRVFPVDTSTYHYKSRPRH
jgi:putative transposase